MKNRSNPGIIHWMKGLMFRRIHGMLTCREFEDFVLDYLDNELPESQHKQFELHLRLCRECRQYVQAYQRTIDVSQANCRSAEKVLPEDVPEDLIKAILETRDS
ncbi:MAG: zf-HC2 domain-containing protein [Gammaproteobacteria bacterium]|nr:zf-HC2 domain-containing protein [Gammaproteobacteria bacterium]